MKPHKDQNQPDRGAAAKRARLEGLLWNGATLGTTLLVAAMSAGPKTPPWQGE